MRKLISVLLSFIIMLTGCAGSNMEIPESVPQYIGNTVTVSDSQEFVESMGMGWNLGNTLDPVNCTWVGNELDYETAWGNPRATKELISFVKAEGFDTIRIPVTWTNHVSEAPDYIISEAWMSRVQEVVNWCVEEDMYVILNIHHEGEWITTASTDYDGVMQKYRAIWTQIADRFGDYSNKLIFESMNEIGFDDLGTVEGCKLVNKINAEFVELIRGSGKNNINRYILLAGYWTDIDRSVEGEGITVPEGDDKLIVSMHYYSPSTFAIADKTSTWGYRETWGTPEDYTYLEGQMIKLKEKFLDNGIPVIMGEYGCTLRDKDAISRLNYLAAVNEYCLKYGICPVLWDNGEEIDRYTYAWRTAGLADALRSGK